VQGNPVAASKDVSAPMIDKNAANSSLSFYSSPLLQKSGKDLAASVISAAHFCPVAVLITGLID